MTVNQSRIKIDSSVLPGLDVLSEEERANVLKSIDSLENFSIDRPLASNIKKLNEEEHLYLLQVDASLRIIFDVTSEDRIEILELFRRKTIEYMFRKKAQ
ncbi:hypothetical protein [Aerosakkonema funiforme]|uniref:hypothetical protein n=1 Tax=Aerosakkonema funiforme TaxID=1246630 RepID=UPI0035B8BB5F